MGGGLSWLILVWWNASRGARVYESRWPACCGFFFSSRRRHTRLQGDWSSDVCSSDLAVDDDEIVGAIAIVSVKHQEAGLTMTIPCDISGRILHEHVEIIGMVVGPIHGDRSEERRVGKECRSRWSPYH